MIQPIAERRISPRLSDNIPLKVSCEEADFVTQTFNISCSGAYCRVQKYVEPLTKLQIQLLIPKRKNGKVSTKKISCAGVVVRVEPLPGNEFFNIAIFFNDIKPGDKKFIADYVHAELFKSN